MVSPSRNQSGGGGKNATVVVEDDKECMEQVGGGEDDGIIITKEEEEKDDDHGDDDEVTPRRKRRRVVTCFCISLTQLVEERRKETGNPNLSEEDVLEEIRDYNDKSIERINNNIPHEKINRPAIPLITLEEAECYLAAKRSRSHPVFRCIVTGLVHTIDTEDLVKAFSPFGDIIDSKVLKERHTGRSREFGYVAFSSEASALAAVEAMNGQDLHGRIITVIKARSTR